MNTDFSAFPRFLWRKRVPLGLFGLTVLAVIFLSQAIRHYQTLQSEADQATASLFFSPNNDSLTSTVEQTFPVWINATQPIGFASIKIKFDPNKLVLKQTPAPIHSALSQIVNITSVQTANESGIIEATVTVPPAKIAEAPSSSFQFLSLVFDAKQTGEDTTSVSFDLTGSQVVSTSTTEFTLTETPLTLTLNPSVHEETSTLSFSPLTATKETGGTFDTTISVDTLGRPIYGVDTVITFDPNLITITELTPITNNGFTSYPLNIINNETGTIKLSANIGTGANPPEVKGRITLASIKGIAKSAGTASLTYSYTPGERNDSNIIAQPISQEDPQDILTHVSAYTLTITEPIPAPTHSYLFKLSFQGKTNSTVSKQFSHLSLSYLTDGQVNLYTKNSLNTNNVGHFLATLSPGQHFFLLKVPGYLARRLPASATPVTLLDSDQTLDFTGTPLLGGDLNEDGEVNEIDYTLKFLPVFGKEDSLADFDGSGQVNNLDFAVMRVNWNLVDETLE